MTAVDYLERTTELLEQRQADMNADKIRINIDLSELHGYHYQTGVVFAAFVPQLGQAIARGGRYDDIGKVFGRARAATGFSTDLKTLSQLSKKQFVRPDRIFAPLDEHAGLKEAISSLRAQGRVVIEQLPGQQGDAKSMGCNKQLCLVDGQWVVKK
jgi:ATP phosphoribosyltransferase regulatory subunit